MGCSIFREQEEREVYFLGVPILKITTTHLIFYRNIFPFYNKSILLDDVIQYSIYTQKNPWRTFYRIKIHTQTKEVLLNFYFLDKIEAQEALNYIKQLTRPSSSTPKTIKATLNKSASKIITLSNTSSTIDVDYWIFNFTMILLFYIVTSPILAIKIFNFLELTAPLAPHEFLSRFWFFIFFPLIILNVPNFELIPEFKALIKTLFSTKTTITSQQIIIKKTKFPFIGKTIIPTKEIGLLQQKDNKTPNSIEIIKTSGEHILLPIAEYSLQEVENILYSNPENNILVDQ